MQGNEEWRCEIGIDDNILVLCTGCNKNAPRLPALGRTGTSSFGVPSSFVGGGRMRSLINLVTLSIHSALAKELPPNFIVTSIGRARVEPGRSSEVVRLWLNPDLYENMVLDGSSSLSLSSCLSLSSESLKGVAGDSSASRLPPSLSLSSSCPCANSRVLLLLFIGSKLERVGAGDV